MNINNNKVHIPGSYNNIDLPKAKHPKRHKKIDHFFKKDLKNHSNHITVKHLFERAWKWIKSISHKITGLFKKHHLHAVTKSNKSLLEISAPLAIKKVEGSKKEKTTRSMNSDKMTVSTIVHSLKTELGILQDDINHLKLENLDDYRHLKEIQAQIKEQIAFLSESSDLLSNPDDNKTVDELKTAFKELDKDLKSKMDANQPIINKLMRASGIVKSKKRKREAQLSNALIKNLVTPPRYVNSDNNCWHHASLQLLWVWNPYFSDLLKEKMAQLDQLKKSGIKLRHEYPADPIILLEALQALNDAMDSGKLKAIRLAADQIQRAVAKFDRDFQEEGQQQDPADALLIILNLISVNINADGTLSNGSFFEVEKRCEGLGKYKKLKENFSDKINYILQLPMVKNKTSFQEILNSTFLKETVNDPKNSKLIEGTQVPHFTIKTKIKKPPEFLFVHMKRFEYSTHEEIKKEMARVNEEKKQMISDQVKKLMSGSDKIDDLEVAKITAEEQLKDEFPRPDIGSKKIETPIDFPANHQINFASAFGVEKSKNSDYTYELRGVILHSGDLEYGHYTANVVATNPKNGKEQWFHCNDQGSKIDPISNEEALNGNSNGYIYYFVKVKKNNTKIL